MCCPVLVCDQTSYKYTYQFLYQQRRVGGNGRLWKGVRRMGTHGCSDARLECVLVRTIGIGPCVFSSSKTKSYCALLPTAGRPLGPTTSFSEFHRNVFSALIRDYPRQRCSRIKIGSFPCNMAEMLQQPIASPTASASPSHSLFENSSLEK